MKTTIIRQGRVTQLSFKDKDKAAVINFRGGYVKFIWSDSDIPDGLMLGDSCEISIEFQEAD